MKKLIPDIILEHYRRGRFTGGFEAAAVSVDISGFTALAETLVQHGQSGAEILTQVLNQILSPLVREVYEQGGFVAAFAGDSLTALFPVSKGEEASLSSLRIAQSAWRRIRKNRTVPTPFGPFEIGVRIGLSRGSVKFGIPGGRMKHTYYFRGPGIEGCSRALAHAGKGEILVTGELLNSLGPSIRTAPAEGFHRLTDLDSLSSTPMEHIPERGSGAPASEEELSRFVLDGVLDLVKSGASAEFRRVTATFVSFDDSMADGEINRFVTTVLELSGEYGGHFNKLLFDEKGGVILVIFGAPLSHENDCRRTADFILALREREPRVEWMAGSTFGTVYAGLVGCEERCEYTAIGDVVNLAARIAQRKDWGEFRMNLALAEKLQDTHAVHLVDTFRFKGKKAPLPVYRLTERKSVAGSEFYSGLMVGRSRELERLRQWMNPVLEGRFAGVMHICGDAGIGKSRLAEELRRRIGHGTEAPAGEGPTREVQWFLCPSDEILRKSLNPFRHFLRRYFHQQPNLSQEENTARFDRALDDLITFSEGSPAVGLTEGDDDPLFELERTRSFLGALVDLYWPGSLYSRLEPRLRFPNTLLALKALFKAESRRKPVILVIEDIQWLDADSGELLQLLTRNIENYSLAVLCTARHRDDGTPVTLQADPDVPRYTMELRPLGKDGVRSMARQLLGAGISDELSAFLLEKTASNPFFVEQLLLDLRERGALELREEGKAETEGPKGDEWVLNERTPEIPQGISAVLLARLDRLAAEVRHTVQTAAVLGREFPIQVLSRMLRDDETLTDNVKRAESARIWTSITEFRYLFRHALLRDAAYQMQMRARLRSLHQLAAEAMEQVYREDLSPHYAQLAYHYGQAEVDERERVYAELAGSQAADSFANREALKYLSRALELTPEGRGRFKLMSTRERVFDLLGMRSEQERELAAMEELANDLDRPELKAVAILRRGQYAADTSEYPAAMEAVKRCIALTEREDPSGELVATGVKAFNVWGISLMSQGHFDEARKKLEQALESAERIDAPEQQVAILSNLGMLHALQGGFQEAITCWNRGLEISRDINDLLHETAILLNLGNAAFSQGDLKRARTNWERALAIFQEIGYRTGAAHALLNLGVLLYQLGSYHQAMIHYRQALSITRETNDRQTEGMALGNLGNVLAKLGEYDEARQHYLKALSLRGGIGDNQGEGIVLGYLCQLDQLCGNQESAEDYGKRSLAVTREIGDRPNQARTLTFLGHLLAAQNRLDEAEDHYGKALNLYDELGQKGQAPEPLAGMAEVALRRNNTTEAMSFVEEILEYLKGSSLDSTGEPFTVYLTCFNVLKANNDSRSRGIITTAAAQLRERAERIQDEHLRNGFLKKVAANRMILELEQPLET